MEVNRLFSEAQRLHRRGRLSDAKKRYQQILGSQPDHGEARLFLAIILQQHGQMLDALNEARQAIANISNPDAGVLTNYGIILKNSGRFDEAERAYRQALQLAPENRAVKANLATLQFLLGKLDQAERAFSELIEVFEEAAPWLNLARIALQRDDHVRAAECLRHADDIDPKHPDTPFLYARTCAMQKDDAKAFDYLVKTLRRQLSHLEAWQLLQSLDRAVLRLDVITDLANDFVKSGVQQGTLLAIVVDLCRKNLIWGPLPKLEAMLCDALEMPLVQVPSVSVCFTLLGANVPQRSHLIAARAAWQQLSRRIEPFSDRKLSARKGDSSIRVAFLSSDLRGHAVGFLIVGLMERLPKEKIEWWVYNNSFSDDSETRWRIRQGVDRFVNIASLNSREAAERIRQDTIDILIDLNGMTRDTRVEVLAFRPAPIQLTWLGMPGTLGAGDAVDYVIGDAWTTPAHLAEGFDEKIVQLPRSYQPNDHLRPDLSLAGCRADHGLPEHAVVFCCFNQHYKISPDTFDLWCQILRQVDDSVLWLLDTASDAQRDRLRYHLREAGIDPDRLVLAGRKPQTEHIARIALADLVLDTRPYNAHTTCSDALRAGVPVVTLPGETFAARVAASILETGNLAEWIVDSPAAYVDKAVTFGNRPRAEIEAVKQQVRETYWASPMVDNAALGEQFEALCLGLYDRHAAGMAAEALRLDPDGNLCPLQDQDALGEAASLPASAAGVAPPPPPSATAVDTPTSPSPAARAAEPSTSGPNARIENLRLLQRQVLGIDAPPLVLDIGARPEGRLGFEVLVDAGLARSLGFEADTDACQQISATPNRQVLSVALGDGQPHTLHLCRAGGMNSIYEPDQAWLRRFPGFSGWGAVQGRVELTTVRLDDVEDAQEARFAKLDVQGAELMILQHGQTVLGQLAVIEVEASPTPLYENEPTLWQLGQWLFEQGFVLHTFSNENKRMLKPLGDDGRNQYSGLNQILQVDAVFVPHPDRWPEMENSRLLALAFFSHALYRSYDLAMAALQAIDIRQGSDLVDAYKKYLKEAGFHA